MKPAGPLMIEHRLIERMIVLMKDEGERIGKTGKANVEFLEMCIDFVRKYADRCHHGKEEDILFRELDKKKLTPEHRRAMDELVEQHMWARGKVRSLTDDLEKYKNGESGKLSEIGKLIGELVGFYPAHIETEDRHFFAPVMNYFDSAEQAAMLDEFREFDSKLIHEIYKERFERLE